MLTTEEIYYGYEIDSANDSRDKALALAALGWRATYAALFDHGQSFVDVLAKHHIDSIEWHWHARIDVLEGRKPQYYADFPKFSRGHMKSTIARRVAVIDAFLSYAYGVGGYCLYFSGTEDKTEKHAVSINNLLTSKGMQEYAPGLTRVKRAEEGNRALGWKATFFYTEAGYIFHFGSLQSGLAGGNVDDLRPTLMVPDDIDDRKDSVAEAERNTKAFTKEILPMGKTGTLTFFAQNLISRFSVMYRIHKGKLKVLTNRRPSEPVPAVANLEITYRTVGGISMPFITAGAATWEKGMPLSACEEELQRIGEESFLSECQHEVELARSGLVHKRYEDAAHAVSYSQFAAVFGSPDAWKEWHKVPFSDWARTKTKFHANVAGYLAVSSQNTVYPGFTFCVPLSFPADTSPEDVAVRLLSTLTVQSEPGDLSSKTWQQLVDDAWKRNNEQEHYQTTAERLEFAKAYYKTLIPKYSRPVLRAFRVAAGANSHSEDQVRGLFNDGFGFSFIPANPGQTDALEEIDSAMRIDYDLPHIFDPSKNGYTRWAVLCPDDKTQPAQIINDTLVYPPMPYPDAMEGDALHDSELFRYQMCNRRFADPKVTATGETIDVMLKLDDDFGQCLIGETLVTTSEGDVRIQDVKVNDFVWTRKGYKRVIASEMTGAAEQTYKMFLSNGTVLQGTKSHPIYVQNKGFIPLQMVQKGDILLGICELTNQNQFQNDSCFEALPFTAIPNQKDNPTAGIFSRILATAIKELDIYTLKYGRRFTAIFRKVSTFTTLTEIMTTIIFPTWKLLPSQSIPDYTPININIHRNDSLNCEKFSRFRTFREGRRKVENVPAKRRSQWLWIETLSRIPLVENAITAAMNTAQGKKQADFAETIAPNAPEPVLKRADKLKPLFLKIVFNAVQNFWRRIVFKNFAPKIAVLTIQRADVQSVFNLEVEEQPEFYANGILVHNCLQMVYFKKLLSNIGLTKDETREMHLAPQNRAVNIEKLEDSAVKDSYIQKRKFEIQRIDREVNKPLQHPAARRYARR